MGVTPLCIRSPYSQLPLAHCVKWETVQPRLVGRRFTASFPLMGLATACHNPLEAPCLCLLLPQWPKSSWKQICSRRKHQSLLTCIPRMCSALVARNETRRCLCPRRSQAGMFVCKKGAKGDIPQILFPHEHAHGQPLVTVNGTLEVYPSEWLAPFRGAGDQLGLRSAVTTAKTSQSSPASVSLQSIK